MAEAKGDGDENAHRPVGVVPGATRREVEKDRSGKGATREADDFGQGGGAAGQHVGDDARAAITSTSVISDSNVFGLSRGHRDQSKSRRPVSNGVRQRYRLRLAAERSGKMQPPTALAGLGVQVIR